MTFKERLELVRAIPELEKTAEELKPFHEDAENYLKVASEEDFQKEILTEQAYAKIAGFSEDKIPFQRTALGAYKYEEVSDVLKVAYESKEYLEGYEAQNGEGSVHQEITKEAEAEETFANLPMREACEALEVSLKQEKNAAFDEAVSYINTSDPVEVIGLL